MGHKSYRVLQTFAILVGALSLAGCGSNPTSSSMNPPGNAPPASNSKAASGPVLGAWWDADRKGLRTVYGVAGAAYEDAPSYNDGSYNGATVCMRKGIALLTASSGSLYSVSLPQGKPIAVTQKGVPKASIVFSPSCTSALVYASANSRALLVEDLLSNAKTNAVTLPSGIASAVVADSGAILVDVPAPDGSAAIQLAAGGSGISQPVAVLSRFGGMVFLPGADTALLADAAMNAVVEASHVTSTLSVTQIAGENDGISKPVAIGVSADGRWAAIANKGSSVVRLDLSNQSAPAHAVCNCSPTELEPLAGNFAFRLNEPGSGTVWAFDGNPATPRVVFIPADQPAPAAQGAHP